MQTGCLDCNKSSAFTYWLASVNSVMTLLFLLLFCGDWCVSVAEEPVIAKWDSSSESGLQMLSKVNLAAGVTVFDF